MQQTGTLRKRRRRNLAKVNGLSTIPYEENLDLFTGRTLFTDESSKHSALSFVSFTERETLLKFSAQGMLEHRREAGDSDFRSRARRVTRDPSYNDFINESDDFTITTGGAKIEAKPLPEYLHSRSHLLDESAMRRLKQILLLGATSGAFPWKWNAQEYRIDKWSPFLERMWGAQWAFITLQMCFLCVFQMYAFYESFGVGRESYRSVFQSSLSLLWYLWALAFNLNLYLYKDAIRHYVNTMLAFNQANVQKYLVHLDGYKMSGRLVINVVTLTNMGQVFVSVSQFLRMSDRPWYLFSYIYPKPWYWLIPGTIQEYTIAGQVITSYILLTWIMVAHTNTLQFWLREIHNNNDSDYTTDELRAPKMAVETYKSLLILNQVFNECMSPLAWPALKFHLAGALVPCGFILIRSINHIFWDEFPGIVLYPVGIWDCTIGGFVVLNMASGVFDLGCSCIDSWSRTKQKDFRRILMGCPTFKIWVSRFYFVTISTTLTFFKKIFDVITDLIITLP